MKKIIEFGEQLENFEAKTQKALKKVGVVEKKYKTCSLDRVRGALLKALNGGREAIISQQKIRIEIDMSNPTWHKCTAELRGREFDFLPVQRATLLKKIN